MIANLLFLLAVALVSIALLARLQNRAEVNAFLIGDVPRIRKEP